MGLIDRLVGDDIPGRPKVHRAKTPYTTAQLTAVSVAGVTLALAAVLAGRSYLAVAGLTINLSPSPSEAAEYRKGRGERSAPAR